MSDDSTILAPTDQIVDTILHGNNNFVSTLDHLPCDIIRCLWVIQMMNLRNVRLEKKLGELLQNPDQNAKEISRLNRIILRNTSEAEFESKYAVNILNAHLDILQDDREIHTILKKKLPGWTSEAVERRWKEWGVFKKQYLERQREITIPDIFSNFKLQDETENGSESNGQSPVKKLKITKNGEVTNGTKKPNLKLKTSSGSGGLKIKLSLKSPDSSSSGVKRRVNIPLSKKNRALDHEIKGIKKKSTAERSHTNVSIAAKILPQPVSELTVKEEPLVVPKEEHYCFCGGPSFGRMVACENEKCPHEWFHFKCVGLTREPEGAWFCSKACEEQYRRTMMRKKKKKRRNW